MAGQFFFFGGVGTREGKGVLLSSASLIQQDWQTDFLPGTFRVWNLGVESESAKRFYMWDGYREIDFKLGDHRRRS